MATILVKNVPDDIHLAIKDRAKRHFRSLNNEIIACLQDILFTRRIDPKVELERIRHLRKQVKGFLTDEILDEMIDRGRQ
ncbi:MAG: Arc family DNA-binding protein [Candidatus Riflebacteria bacterium]|nr:Arc family DNA-binding protein [Candidatus Riflebacteria bacterium]